MEGEEGPVKSGSVALSVFAPVRVLRILVKPPNSEPIEAFLIHLERGRDQKFAWQLLDGVLNRLGRIVEADIADGPFCGLTGEELRRSAARGRICEDEECRKTVDLYGR